MEGFQGGPECVEDGKEDKFPSFAIGEFLSIYTYLY